MLRGGRAPAHPALKHPETHAPPPGVVMLDLPLPPDVLRSNGRTRNYKYRAKMVARARDEAATAAIAAENRPARPWKHAKVHVTFYVSGNHDKHNLAHWCKASIDGLQGVLIESDAAAEVLEPAMVKVPRGGRQGMTIRVEGQA